MEKKLPLGVRLCNPGNVRSNSNLNIWQGQIGSQKGFCWFTNNYYGVRCLVKILEKYYNRGWLSTPVEFVSHYAPESDGNNVKSYVNFVSSAFEDGTLHIIHLVILIMQQEIGIKFVDDELMFYASYLCHLIFQKYVTVDGKVDFETGFSWNYVR